VRENGVRITVWSEKDRKKGDDEKGDQKIMSAASDEGGRSGPPFFWSERDPAIDRSYDMH
jgi:hypothetical protein